MADSDSMPASPKQVTRLLSEIPSRPEAAEELLPLVYEQLRALAQRHMRGERRQHTLQATALVHEVYLRLVGDREPAWESQAHFFRVAADAMRRYLIDHARRRDAAKRGGGKKPLPLSVVDLAVENDADQVLALEEAMQSLEREDAAAFDVVRLRFFAGLSVEETAHVLGCSERTVMREWSFARVRLYQLLGEQGGKLGV
ncbi:MAG: sigma-70 family RNA polymerase sigma factor [Phycisphaerales bacterium]|nr:sigma-70 family RNA polymerase sigma factor [Phycisphaerales bacterium]